MEIIRIVNEDIPLPDCRIKAKEATIKRIWLLEKIKGLIQKELKEHEAIIER